MTVVQDAPATMRDATNEIARLRAINEELVGRLDELLADVLNLGSWSIKSRLSVENARAALLKAKEQT